MWYRPLFAAALIVAAIGCTPPSEPVKSPVSQPAPDDTEKDVRAVIADLLGVDSSAIPMDKAISEPPLKADDLDLVEIVMELEERLSIQISDATVERYLGAKLGKGPIQITPNQLVSIVRESPKVAKSKKKK